MHTYTSLFPGKRKCLFMYIYAHIHAYTYIHTYVYQFGDFPLTTVTVGARSDFRLPVVIEDAGGFITWVYSKSLQKYMCVYICMYVMCVLGPEATSGCP